MNELFLKILNMSLSASWLILAVLILRLALGKSPKWIRLLLWGIVAVRLSCPVAIESPVSLIPDSIGNGAWVSEWADDYIGDHDVHFPDSVYYDAAIGAGREPIPDGEGGFYVVTKPDQLGEASTIENTVVPVLSVIWVSGMAFLAIYTAISYGRLRRKVDTAVRYQDNIFQSEQVSSPFVLGIIRPRIYLPFQLGGQALTHVVAHEQAHIRRRDHWWKPLGFLLLTVHWFNPVMWLAYVLLCRDIELACDEKVIKALGNEHRADYTQALLGCSMGRAKLGACPLAFGEVSVKDRVKAVLHYKKPGFWFVAAAVLVCAVVAVCFLTNPITNNSENTVIKWFDYLEEPDEMPWDDTLETKLSAFPDVTFRWQQETVEAVTEQETVSLYWGMPIWNTYFCDLTGDKLPELCSTYTLGSGMIDSRVIIYDYANGTKYELSDRGYYDYTLRFNAKDGCLYVDKTKYNTNKIVESGRLVFNDNCIQVEGFSNEPSTVFQATVLEIHEGYFLVEPVQDSWAINTADRIEVPMQNMDPSLEPQVGDIIEISYSGEILETYPARLREVYYIRVTQEAEKWDRIPMVMVDGALYLDTGFASTTIERTDHFDGQITSQVDGSEKPTVNDQSNFGTGYGYQFGATEGTIEIYMNGEWWIFATEEVRPELRFPTSADAFEKYYLTIGAEGVTSIEITSPNTSGGCQRADGSPFEMGERIWLENLDGFSDLRGVTIAALNENGDIVWTATIADEEENKGFTRLTQDGWTIANLP